MPRRVTTDRIVPLKRPPRLKRGDTIGIAAPAGPFDKDLFEEGMAILKRMGFKLFIPEPIFRREGFLAGTDTERAEVINTLFSDPAIQGILCARGGYGSTRVLPHLDWPTIRRHPKVFMGFSDITVLHNVFLAQAGLVTFHGPMGTTLIKTAGPYLGMMEQALMSETPIIMAPERAHILKHGEASGPVVGGNLTMLSHLVGTPYQPVLNGGILFLEDVTESPYRIDRVLEQLSLAGCLQGVQGLVLGRFLDCGDGDEIHDVFLRVFGPSGIPIVAGFPIGHGEDNATLPIGIHARLTTQPPQLSYLTAATA